MPLPRRGLWFVCWLFFALPIAFAGEEEKESSDEASAVKAVCEDEANARPQVVRVIKNVTVYTQAADGILHDAVVIIRNGMIEAVGEELEIPDGADIVDGGGGVLTPGLIDGYGKLWMTSTAVSDTSTTAALRTVDALDAFDREYRPVVAQGITSVVLAPSARGRLGGSVAVVAAAPLKNRFDATIKAPQPKREPKWEEADQDAESKGDKKSKGDEQESKREKPSGDAPEKDDQADEKSNDDESEKAVQESNRSASARPISASPHAAEKEDGDDQGKKPALKTGSDKVDAKPAKADGKPKQAGGKKPDGKAQSKRKIVEVPFDIPRPQLAFSSGSKGWVLVPDAAVAASLGIAASDGRGRVGEFNAIKKQLEDAVTYHEKWDKYRVWKANQDRLPPDQRAKPKKRESTSADQRRAEIMRRIAAMRAQRASGGTSSAAGPSSRSGKPPEPKSKSAANEKASTEKKAADKAVEKPEFDPKREILRPILRGKLPIWMFVDDAKSLARAQQLAKIGDCRLILVQGSDLPAADLAGFRNAAIVGPFSSGDDATRSAWARRLSREDATTGLGTFGAASADSANLRMEMALAVANGVSRQRVLDAVTSDLATVLGCGDWLGKIAPGYRADLALFAGDPIDPATAVKATWSLGEPVYQNSRVTAVPESSVQVASLSDEDRRRAQELVMPAAYEIVGSRLQNSAGELLPGRMTVRNGKITAVEFTESSQAVRDRKGGKFPVLDVGNLVVTPGLVCAGFEIAAGPAGRVPGEPDSGYLVAADRFDPTAPAIEGFVEGGVLAAALLPPSQNVAAGQVSAVRLGGDATVLDPSIADSFVISDASRNSERYPASLEGQVDFLKKRFAGNFARNRSRIPSIIQEPLDRKATERYRQLSAGQRRALITAGTAAEIRAARRFIDQQGLKASLHKPQRLDAFGRVDDASTVGIIAAPLSPTGAVNRHRELVDAANNGHPIGIAARTPEQLRQTAAILVAAGLPLQRVAKIVTSEAAAAAGMPAGVGKLQVGQPADFVIWSHHPCLMSAECLAVIADGQRVSPDQNSSSGGASR